MPIGTYSWLSDSDMLSKTQLDQELRLQAVAITQFRALSRPDKFYGAHKGDSVQVTKMAKLAVRPDPISELSEMPLQRAVFNKVTVTVQEYGDGVPYSGKAKTLSQIALDESLKKALNINMTETMDKVAYINGFAKADYFAVPTGTSGAPTVTFQEGSAPTASATRHVQILDIREIVTEFKKKNIPRYDGAYYLGVFSPTAMKRLFADTGASGTMELYKYDMPEVLIRGEIGTYYGLRLVEETNALPFVLGSTSYEGEFVVCGFEPVVEALAQPESVRTQTWDFDRQNAIAWNAITGFAPLWSKVNDNYFTIIRVTSA